MLSTDHQLLCIMLYCLALNSIVWIWCIVLYCIVLYCKVLFVGCFVLYCLVLYCIVFVIIALPCIALDVFVLNCIWLYGLVLYCLGLSWNYIFLLDRMYWYRFGFLFSGSVFCLDSKSCIFPWGSIVRLGSLYYCIVGLGSIVCPITDKRRIHDGYNTRSTGCITEGYGIKQI